MQLRSEIRSLIPKKRINISAFGREEECTIKRKQSFTETCSPFLEEREEKTDKNILMFIQGELAFFSQTTFIFLLTHIYGRARWTRQQRQFSCKSRKQEQIIFGIMLGVQLQYTNIKKYFSRAYFVLKKYFHFFRLSSPGSKMDAND